MNKAGHFIKKTSNHLLAYLILWLLMSILVSIKGACLYSVKEPYRSLFPFTFLVPAIFYISFRVLHLLFLEERIHALMQLGWALFITLLGLIIIWEMGIFPC